MVELTFPSVKTKLKIYIIYINVLNVTGKKILKNSRRSLMAQKRWNALAIMTLDHNALIKRYTFQRYSQRLKKYKSQYFKLKTIISLKFKFTIYNVLFTVHFYWTQ